jgi:hypothetical protein
MVPSDPADKQRGGDFRAFRNREIPPILRVEQHVLVEQGRAAAEIYDRFAAVQVWGHVGGPSPIDQDAMLPDLDDLGLKGGV